MANTKAITAAKPDPASALDCSFCGKDSSRVRYLVAGYAGGYICDGCAEISLRIMAAQGLRDALAGSRTGV
ncbi:MAG TPA: ClpX C4-type zinc finger protein [Candidatus Binataceae bacterium]|nr:ClpX C4-type zinc finger protein [Candidatus Binataceae bacterium]